jgi:hypothetical protein
MNEAHKRTMEHEMIKHRYEDRLCNLQWDDSDPVQAMWSTLVVSLIDANHSACSPTWAGKVTYNDSFGRLYWVNAGEGYVEYHGERFRLEPGKLYVIPAQTPSRYSCPAHMDLYWLHFTAHVFVGVDLSQFLHGPYELPIAEHAWMDALWHRLFARYRSNSPGVRYEVDGVLRQFFAPFLESFDLILFVRKNTRSVGWLIVRSFAEERAMAYGEIH